MATGAPVAPSAGNHAAALGWGAADLRLRGLSWVLSRLTLDVDALPAWQKEAVVSTWPSGAHRLWALREFRLSDPAGAVFAKATSGWLIVRLDSKRPSRPPEELAPLSAAFPPRLIDDRFDDLVSPSATAGGPSFTVRRFDLDLNGHANNVALVRWLLESLPPERGSLALPLRTRIELRAECFEGDLLKARVDREGGVVRHSLVREADGREVARARTELPDAAP